MKIRLTAFAILALALNSCDSAFSEPDSPIDDSSVSDERTRNQDASDSSGASGFSIVLEEENVVDIDYSL